MIQIKLSESSAASLISRLLFGLHQLIPRHFIARICHFNQIGLRCLLYYPLESLVHPHIILGRSLRVRQIESLSKCQNLISRHHRVKIAFASHEVHLPLHIVFIDLIDPMREILERLPVRQTKAKQNGMRSCINIFLPL